MANSLNKCFCQLVSTKRWVICLIETKFRGYAANLIPINLEINKRILFFYLWKKKIQWNFFLKLKVRDEALVHANKSNSQILSHAWYLLCLDGIFFGWFAFVEHSMEKLLLVFISCDSQIISGKKRHINKQTNASLSKFYYLIC